MNSIATTILVVSLLAAAIGPAYGWADPGVDATNGRKPPGPVIEEAEEAPEDPGGFGWVDLFWFIRGRPDPNATEPWLLVRLVMLGFGPSLP